MYYVRSTGREEPEFEESFFDFEEAKEAALEAAKRIKKRMEIYQADEDGNPNQDFPLRIVNP